MFHIIGAMAEFERELIKERVKAGLDNARRKGKRIGRKPVSVIERTRILDCHRQNPELSIRDLADKLGMKKSLVHKTLKILQSEVFENQTIAA